MDQFYEGAGSLFVQAYDAFYGSAPPPIAGDMTFYERMARETAGPVLEIGCGTGRITLALAEAGLEITGVDISAGMLETARHKMRALSPRARSRVILIKQDMSALELGRHFGFVFVPFRSFQHVLTIERQRMALAAVRRHLAPDGRLALHLFDPRFDLLIDEKPPPAGLSGTDPATGKRYVGEILQTRFDYLAQIRRDLWRYTEFDPDGEVLRRDTREMALRWTYRWELHHLLELCGFAVEAEYSDFTGAPPAYGGELIVVARPG
jgi:ubiquinone/menaquinone biosynthesis C-methylase UbiE